MEEALAGELLVVYGALYERLTMIKGGVGYLTFACSPVESDLAGNCTEILDQPKPVYIHVPTCQL